MEIASRVAMRAHAWRPGDLRSNADIFESGFPNPSQVTLT
jgi:hypothetical protein